MPKIGKFYPILIFIGFLVLSVGIILKATSSRTCKDELAIDYTNIGQCSGEKSNATCPEYLEQHKEWRYCICYMEVVLDKSFNAPIDLYYELDTYDQTKIADSKDDEQLSGKLSEEPSSKCGNYSKAFTAEGIERPIAPCGALADAMFNDTFSISINTNSIPMVSGVISTEDKANFHNPPGNLTKAFENFTMPINWPKETWDHFLKRDNAFESEKFVGWMNTAWKRKPYARINETLPKDIYTLRVAYNYPVSLYNGTRKLILSSPTYKFNNAQHVAGIVLIVIGCLVLAFGVAGVILVIFRQREKESSGSRMS